MKKRALLLSMFWISIPLYAGVFEGIEYQPPAGWTSQPQQGALGFVPNHVTPETGTVIVLGASEKLDGDFDSWFRQKLAQELIDGSKVLQGSEIQSQRQEEVQRATIAQVVQDPRGTTTIRMYHGVTDGRRATIAVAMSVSEEAMSLHSGSIRSFFESLRIRSSDAQSPQTSASAGGERVPDSGVVRGVPQGIFIGRSLLTGKTVCLMFLSKGRITRAVPAQDLDHFDWNQHASDFPGDSGTWEIHNGRLRIQWGDGGVHEGPLQANAGSIEFYGKTYIKPIAATLEALAGKWEAVRGAGIAGGSARMIHTLTIDRSGRFYWHTGGGSTGPRSSYEDVKDMRGLVKIEGRKLVFQGDDGTVESYAILAISGNPLSIFALGGNLFSRIE